jgi:cystathionine beta-lyase/cystathionine gamma-synthase
MGFKTKQIHDGVTPDPVTGSILTPIYQTTTYVQDSVDEYLAKGYSYSRSGNPTVTALEDKINALDGGSGAICFGTGMAAVNALFLAFLNAGDHCIISDVVYGGTYRLSTKVYSRFGVEFTMVDTSDPENVRKALRDNTRLILTESPANPTLKMTDIAAISAIAKQAGVLHAVDNTFMTPYLMNVLELGADMAVYSTTKYFDGHNATVGGAIVCATEELHEKVRFIMNATGSIMSPQVAWLTLQGVKTLSVRMDGQSENAQILAEYLEQHPKVEQVCYPGLPSFAQHELAKTQASGFGAILWFEVKGGVEAGKRFMDNVDLFSLAENLGSIESLVTHPVTMTHADVEEAERQRVGILDGLIRISVGLEDAEDLVAALEAALAKV